MKKSKPDKPKTEKQKPDASSKSIWKIINTFIRKKISYNQEEQTNNDRHATYERTNNRILAGILIVTTIYAYFAYGQWSVLRESMQITNRACVSFKHISLAKVLDEKGEKVVAFRFTPQWENSGNTPTQNMTTLVTAKWPETPLPENYEFPDPSDPKPSRIHMGPHTTFGVGFLDVPIEKIIAFQNHSLHLYVYGWAKYQDILKYPHITRFCWEVNAISGDPKDRNTASMATFAIFSWHNCADEECEKK